MTELTTPPDVTPNLAWRFPLVTEHVLDNGMRVLAYECPGQYVIATTIVFDVPLAAEPREIEGVAALTGRLLANGAGGRTAEGFADALALCGADLDIGAGVDSLVAHLEVPLTSYRAGLGLLADALRRPTLAHDEFANERRLRLDEIEQEKAYPTAVSSKVLARTLYPESARRSRPSAGTNDSVTALTNDDVRAYASRHLGPARTTVIVAGAIPPAEAVEQIQQAFGDWVGEDQAPAGFADAISPVGSAQVVLVDQPDAPQATIRVAAPVVGRDDPRWAPMFVANYCVGGSFGSRINSVLREEKGLTYGSDASLQTSRGAGVLVVSTAARGDAMVEAVSDIVRILDEAHGTLTDDEIGRGVRAVSESMALGFERASSVAARAELLVSSGLPLDHVDSNLAAVRAVTTASANQAYDEIVSSQALTAVLVGDAASQRAGLEAWGYAPIRTES